MAKAILAAATCLALLLSSACSAGSAGQWTGFGEAPELPPPRKSLLPTVHIAPAKGWPSGLAPVAPPGFIVTRFAQGLDHPRWIYVLPNGDVLVAQSSTEPSRPKGLQDWVMQWVQKRAGALQKSPNTIELLRDADGDGVAEAHVRFAQGLTRPFGMALVDGTLYVANDNGVVSFPYRDGQTTVSGVGAKVTDLPGGPINHHWTKNLIASPDGATLFASVGSNSNAAENGIPAETGRASIWAIDRTSGKGRVFASGLRNPNGMDFEPMTGALWTAVNERDMLGDDLVPDYMTSVRDGGFYGWPYSYFGQHLDARVTPQRPDLVGRAIVPDYALGPHTASLGLTFYKAAAFPAHYRGGAFVGQHGSWNRKPLNGYRVVFVPFAHGRPQQPPEAFLTGFVDADGKAMGRPGGVAVDARGALLVADDVGNIIWRVAAVPSSPAQ